MIRTHAQSSGSTALRRLIAVGALLLIATHGSAELKPTITGSGDLRLDGDVGTEISKVYIVQLRSPSAAEHHASLASAFKQKSSAGPQLRTAPKFQKNSAATMAYTATLESEQAAILARTGNAAEKIYSYKYSLNGFAARMTPSDAEMLKDQPEVVHVWEDEIRPLTTRHSGSFLGLFDNESGLRSKQDLDGEDVIIAFIDSGIAPENPALQDTREADRPRLCRSNWGKTSLLGKWLCGRYDRLPNVLNYDPVENWSGECEAGENFEQTLCNNKLIGARWFIDGAENSGPIDEGEFRSPRDADGHGTHTATTAAGNRTSASIFGTLIGDVEGMAPRARVAVYKACWLRPSDTRASCNTSDLANAIDAAVADGVDIINYSVGNSKREVIAPDDVALMAAAKAGVVAVVAAGNDGPEFGTIGSPAGGPWVITAGASSRPGESSVESMQVLTPASIAAKYRTKEALFSPPLADSDPIEGKLVLVDDGDDTLPSGSPGVTSDGCQPLTNSSEVSGNIALMQRSGCLFTDMVRNAEDAGAIAVLVYNIAGAPITMFGDSGLVDIPALMIGQAGANLMLAELDADNEVTVVLEKSLLLTTTDSGNQIAVFSSRGPGPVTDVLKPDVTAPGVNILAGFTPDTANATPGENFAYLSGTSMSTPHVAGVAALLRQAHPDWSAAAIRSALITTARQNLTLSGVNEPANPFDYGGGHIVPNDAFDPGLIYDLSNDEYDAFACGVESPAIAPERCDELRAAGYSLLARDLNQPTVSVSRLINQEVITRTVTNPGDEAETYSVQVTPPPGISVAVAPTSISVAPGASVPFDVTLTYESGPLDTWYYGSFAWVSDDYDVQSSLVVKPASLIAPVEVSSFGGTGSETFTVEFGYDGSYNAVANGLNAPDIRAGFVDNDPTKTFTLRETNGVSIHEFEQPEGDLLFLRFSLFDALTDGDDDLDMYVVYCLVRRDFCNRVGESGEPTSEEQFNIYLPPPGFYYVYIHGFETDEIGGGPGSNYSLFKWQLGENDDPGNLSADAPPLVSSGTTADVTIDWSGLLPDTIYLGGISHITPHPLPGRDDGLTELTIITIRN